MRKVLSLGIIFLLLAPTFATLVPIHHVKAEETLSKGYTRTGYDLQMRNFYPFPTSKPLKGEPQLKWSKDITTETVLAGDIVGDEKLEIIALSSHVLYCFDSSGNELWRVKTPAGGYYGGGLLADVNNDGKLEIFLERSEYPTPEIYVYDGYGKLIKQFSIPGTHDRVFLLHFFNGFNGVKVLLVATAGTIFAINFDTARILWTYSYSYGGIFKSSIADVNGDGKLEFVIGDLGWGSEWKERNPRLRVINEDGIEISSREFSPGRISGKFVDLDKDGKIELLAWGEHWPTSDYSYVYLLDPLTMTILKRWKGPHMACEYSAFPGWGPIVVDLNRDGKDEIIIFFDISRNEGELYVLDHNLAPIMSRKARSSFGLSISDFGALEVLAANDIDGDGYNEVFVRESGVGLKILDHNLNDRWNFLTVSEAFPCDIDGDGINEIIGVNILSVYSISTYAPLPQEFHIVAKVGDWVTYEVSSKVSGLSPESQVYFYPLFYMEKLKSTIKDISDTNVTFTISTYLKEPVPPEIARQITDIKAGQRELTAELWLDIHRYSLIHRYSMFPPYFIPFIASNLDEGNRILPYVDSPRINKTILKTYLNATREVNYVGVRLGNVSFDIYWDKLTGILYEYSSNATDYYLGVSFYWRAKIIETIPYTQIHIPLIPQETAFSCWAASSLMLLTYYGKYSGEDISQIELAREMGNEEYYWKGIKMFEIMPLIGRWEATLERLGKLDFDRDIFLTFDEIVSDINLGRPIMAFVVSETWGIWFIKIPTGLHVGVIAGYIDRPGTDQDEVIILDPSPPGIGTKYLIKWATLKSSLFPIINSIRTKPQVLEGIILTLQETMHKLYLHVYDEKMRHVGFNYETGQVETLIPASRYYDLNGTITIILPLNVTRFSYTVDAKKGISPTENYTVIITILKEGTLTSELKRGGTITQNEKQEYKVTILPDLKKIKVEIVEVPWWQISLYGLPIYVLLIVFMVGCLLAFIKVKITKRRVSVNLLS